MLKHRFFLTQWLKIPIKVSFQLIGPVARLDFDFKPQICQEPQKLAELEVRNFCGDFNARSNTDCHKIDIIGVPTTFMF